MLEISPWFSFVWNCNFRKKGLPPMSVHRYDQNKVTAKGIFGNYMKSYLDFAVYSFGINLSCSYQK